MHRENHDFRIALIAFAAVASILLFYDTIFGGKVLLSIAGQLLSAISPILYGAFIAYLLAPMMSFFESELFEPLIHRGREKSRLSSGAARALSMLLTWAVVCFLFYLLASVLLPELYKSMVQLVSNADTYYRTIVGWVEHLLETNPAVEEWVTSQMNTYFLQISSSFQNLTSFQDFTSWFTTSVLPRLQTVMSTVSGGVVSLVNFLKNLLVGVIVSIYLLATKEQCAAYGRKLACGLFSRKNVGWVLRGVRRADEIFSGFVRGKLLDSMIIGILCFVGCSILKFPYTPLVSVFVGVTNIIPFFGPFLGAIPSTFLILLVSPMKAVYFLIFVLALQQLDGNVIGPKILGDKTGLSSLWVIIAILVGGSFFGLLGMFFGVPVCACLYSLANFLLNTRLRKKGLPEDVEAYSKPEGVPGGKKTE